MSTPRPGSRTTTPACLRRWRRIPIARSSTTSLTRRARRPTSPALLFKGATVTYGELDRLSDACAVGVRGARRHARRSRRPAAPQLPAVLHRPVRRLEARRDRRAAQSDLHRARARRPAARSRHRDRRDADALLPAREEHPARSAACAASSRPTSRSIFPPLLRVLFTLLREKRDGDRIALQPGDHDFAHLLLVNRGRKPAAAPPGRQRSGGPADERRHHRHAEGRARHARRLRHGGAADQDVERDARCAAPQTSSFCRCRCSTSTPTSACSRCRS